MLRVNRNVFPFSISVDPDEVTTYHYAFAGEDAFG
jgi:hypothetical protein